jgi:hypothetical protein
MHTINKLQDLLDVEEFKEPTKSHGIDLTWSCFHKQEE